MALICKYCLMERGIKGSELAKMDLKTEEALIEHIESEHHIAIQREGETEEECMKRFYNKYLEAKDRNTCKCPECKRNRIKNSNLIYN